MSIAQTCTNSYEMNSQIEKNAGGKKGASIAAARSSIDAAAHYSGLLTQGDTPVVIGGGSLGSRQFVETKMKCKDEDTGNMVRLYNWEDNKPHCYENNRKVNCGITKNISLSVSNLGKSLMGFTGVLNTSTKKCKKVTLEVVNACTLNGQHPKIQSGYIESSKIKDIQACAFPRNRRNVKKNPETGMVCESFQSGRDSNISQVQKKEPCCSDMPKDPFIKIYYTSIGLLMLYIIMKMTLRK